MENKLKNHVLHSGGAYGADTAFGWYGVKYGITPDRQHHYRPEENKNLPKQLKDIRITPHILSSPEMDECYKFMYECLEGKKKKKFKRSFADDLKARNYYQVKNSQAIYAVVELTPDFKSVKGGTRYAIEYAKQLKKLIYVFDWTYNTWYVYVDEKHGFELFRDDIPTLHKNFAGIGSRKIQQYQIKDKITDEWVNNPEYVGDEMKKCALNAIEMLYQRALG